MTEAELIVAELARFGVRGRIDADHKHPRVYFWTLEGERFVVCAGTSSDRRAGMKAVARVRRMIGVSGARPKSLRRRPRRFHVPPAIPPMPEITLSRDPFVPLRRHRLMAAVLVLRADCAWRALWRDICLENFGAPSVAASLMERRI